MTLANGPKETMFNLTDFLPKASEHCRVCNGSEFIATSFEMSFKPTENCLRCNLPLTFSNQIMDVSTVNIKS